MNVAIKTPAQIEGIRRSCRLAAQALKFIEPHVVAGAVTAELDKLLEHFIFSHGAVPATLGYRGFPKASCISVNDVICHGIPGDLVLKDGDILNIDVTTILDGYYGDTSTMFAVGEVSETAKKLMRVTKECLDIGVRNVKPGGYVGTIGYWISQHAKNNGFTVVEEFSGHGVGLQFHEGLLIPHFGKRYTGEQLRPGMVFTIEPMINAGARNIVIAEDNWTVRTVDGGLSAQYEYTVLCTEDGVEVLT